MFSASFHDFLYPQNRALFEGTAICSGVRTAISKKCSTNAQWLSEFAHSFSFTPSEQQY